MRSAASVIVMLMVMSGAFLASANERQPIHKQCVETSSGLRQTDDPNSPPCAPYYDGDNGGATWQGVTAEEITLLLYMTSRSSGLLPTDGVPPGSYCDVDLMDCDGDGVPDDVAIPEMRVASAFSDYFNNRYQTYDRRVHTWIYWTGSGASESSRRADAADNWERLKPFAVLDLADGGFHHAYTGAMANRNVMVFSSPERTVNAHHEFHSPMIWSYWPDLENAAYQYASYICAKVAPTNVTGGRHAGEPRSYALYHSAAEDDRHFASWVKQGIAACGVNISPEDEFTFLPGTATRDALTMKRRGYNTVLWAGGANTAVSKWSSVIGYLPEWIVAGDAVMDSNTYARQQGQRTWMNAWVVSSQPRVDHWTQDPAHRAYREADPEGSDSPWISQMYPHWFLTFLAIQLAGPDLTPYTVETALRAIPESTSTSPYSPAGYFPPGDFSFVKDANESWWDPGAYAPDGLIGCHRLVDGGLRYRAADWDEATEAGIGTGVAKDSSRDPCTGYAGSSGTGTL